MESSENTFDDQVITLSLFVFDSVFLGKQGKTVRTRGRTISAVIV